MFEEKEEEGGVDKKEEKVGEKKLRQKERKNIVDVGGEREKK